MAPRTNCVLYRHLAMQLGSHIFLTFPLLSKRPLKNIPSVYKKKETPPDNNRIGTKPGNKRQFILTNHFIHKNTKHAPVQVPTLT
jgi:hypothetical protein